MFGPRVGAHTHIMHSAYGDIVGTFKNRLEVELSALQSMNECNSILYLW